jgi:transposase
MSKKKTLRQSSPETIETLRRLFIKYRKGGDSITDASKKLDVGYSTARRWDKDYKDQGARSIPLKKRGRSKGDKELSRDQEKTIQKMIIDKLPDQLKLPFVLWTREAVRDLIHNLYGIKKSLPQVGRYLKEWGFSTQKPIYKAYEQKPEVVKEWLEVEYPKIKKDAKKADAEILWEDEMGMRSDHQSGTSFAPKGKTPVIKRTGKRFRLNMISAISNQGKKQFMIFKDSFNSEKFITFLRQLIKSSKRKIFLIVDGHPAHKTKLVQSWLEKNKHRIKLYFLPAYSPELNPQEYMNQDIKTNAVGKHRTLNVEQLELTVRNYLKTRTKEKVTNYFKHPKIQYAKA